MLAGWLVAFRDHFSVPVWSRVLVLVAGAVLAPGKRTVSQPLRVLDLAATSGVTLRLTVRLYVEPYQLFIYCTQRETLHLTPRLAAKALHLT